MAIHSVSLIGSGNLATHLAKALFLAGVQIRQVYSRNMLHASILAREVKAESISDLGDLIPTSLLIICVTDSAIGEISHQLKGNPGLIVHTSGSTSLEALSEHSGYGVFYPFQTFSKNVDTDFTQIPVFVEANSFENTQLLLELAQKISSDVKELNSEQRLKLHMAAVFASNFSNHMFAIAKDILKEADLSFELLYPLIRETTSKALKLGDPSKVQTGPAVRANIEIMEKHKDLLADNPLWQKIYTFVSDSIMQKRNTQK